MNLAQRLSQRRIVPFSILPSAINVNTIGSQVMSVSIRTHTHIMVGSQVNLYLPIRIVIIIFCTVSDYALYISSIGCWQTFSLNIYNMSKHKRTNKRNTSTNTQVSLLNSFHFYMTDIYQTHTFRISFGIQHFQLNRCKNWNY